MAVNVEAHTGTAIEGATEAAAERYARVIAQVPTGVLIGGSWRDAATTRRFDVVNPATGTVITTVADGGEQDARAALDAAAAAQPAWAATPPRVRGEILRRAYDLITARADDIALIMTSEMGKPLPEALGEVAYGAEFFRWFAEEAVRISGDAAVSGDGKTRILVTKKPVGPCVLVTPWNFPLAMATRKIGPAIAAGCTMVYKPAALTPLTAFAVADILREAGLPDGVLNIVCTTHAASVVEPWMSSGIARKISFTGSTEVGVTLLKQAAEHVMRTSMELGGNAPFVVFEDADLDAAVEGAMVAKMRNMGEACTAANRLIVHESVAEEFASRLARRMSALVVGDGAAPGTQVGPLIEEKARAKVDALVRDAVDRGARVLTGGFPLDGPGYFYSPTVLVGVDPGADVIREEIFGPVAPVVPFADEAEALRLANDSPFGLVGYVFTRDVERCFRVAEALEIGMIGLNTGLVSNPAAPFGGVKESGLGREGGKWGIEEYLETTYIALPRRVGGEV